MPMITNLFVATYLFSIFIGLSIQQSITRRDVNWRKPSIVNTLDERIALATGAINVGIAELDSTGYFRPDFKSFDDALLGLSGIVFRAPSNSSLLASQMAEFDLLTQRNEYKERFTSIIERVSRSDGNEEYGYAAVRGFKAYNNASLLDAAKSIWDYGRSYTLSSSGDINMYPSIQIGRECKPGGDAFLSEVRPRSAMAGGTFFALNETGDINKTGAYLDISSTAAFALLSASLAEVTTNASYADAADQSILFVQNFQVNRHNETTFINATSCGDLGSLFFPMIGPVGFLTEALTIMSSLPASLQARATALRYEDLLVQEVRGALAMATDRQDGIMTIYMLSGDPYLMRALYQVYRRKPDLRADVKDTIGVQYNALIDLAKDPASDSYGISWSGPANSSVSGGEGLLQGVAASVLVGAIHFDDQGSPSRRKVAVIVGATIGGVAFVTITILIICCTVQKRRHHSSPLNKFTVDVFLLGPSNAPIARGNKKTSVTPIDSTEPRKLEYQPSRAWFRIPRSRKARQTSGGNSNTPVHRASSEARPPQATVEAANSRGQLTTEELVQMLNQRLQPGQWNEDERPPDYISNQGDPTRSQSGVPRAQRVSREGEEEIQRGIKEQV
ncbi:hypothetical protein V5O48_013913 [Marasmius crinis-equi]|uniref:Uncharacterized protein n=1 Tax=Marasmius crinis-equi TaxID=585013 RepID=A0ABR3EYR9_9AGAR